MENIFKGDYFGNKDPNQSLIALKIGELELKRNQIG